MKTVHLSALPVRAAVQSYSDMAVLQTRTDDMAQLHFAFTGSMVVSSDVGHWVVPPSRALWLAPNAGHAIRMYGDVSLCSVLVNPNFALGLPMSSCVLAVSPFFRETISAVMDECAAPTSSRRAILLAELLIDELTRRPELPLYLPVPRDARLATICNHIQTCFDDMKPLGVWAKELGCDERTLHRLFMRELGMSFVRWRQRAKLLRAIEWLAEGQSVHRIALELGYQTQSAFTAMFRRNLGTTPSEFFSSVGTAGVVGTAHRQVAANENEMRLSKELARPL